MSSQTVVHLPATEQEPQKPGVSTVYGPVKSWRFGLSLGIDLIRDISTCSFNCIYCQLGDIQQKTLVRQYFVSTAEVLADLEKSPWQTADIITLSGSGEPTLALNCGEVISVIKALTGKPVMVLTNGTLLHLPEVREELLAADEVAIKLDAASEERFRQMNRPVAGVTLEKIIEGAVAFRQMYRGKLAIQSMFMPANLKEAEALADILLRIQPDEVQLNTPKRPYPLQWVVDTRGNHTNTTPYPTRALKTISPDQAKALEQLLTEKTGLPILSVYQSESNPPLLGERAGVRG